MHTCSESAKVVFQDIQITEPVCIKSTHRRHFCFTPPATTRQLNRADVSSLSSSLGDSIVKKRWEPLHDLFILLNISKSLRSRRRLPFVAFSAQALCSNRTASHLTREWCDWTVRLCCRWRLSHVAACIHTSLDPARRGCALWRG